MTVCLKAQVVESSDLKSLAGGTFWLSLWKWSWKAPFHGQGTHGGCFHRSS